jgi:hypothetical protein
MLEGLFVGVRVLGQDRVIPTAHTPPSPHDRANALTCCTSQSLDL